MATWRKTGSRSGSRDPFYQSREWKAARWEALQRDDYRCVVCGADVSGSRQARVDHIVSIKDDPTRALDLSNLRTLCPEHDAQAHREKGRASHWQRAPGERVASFTIRGCDATGRPLDPNHPWNAGRNGAGERS